MNSSISGSNINTTQNAFVNNNQQMLDNVQKLTDMKADLLRQATDLTGQPVTATGVNPDINDATTNKQIQKILEEVATIDNMKQGIFNSLTTSYQLTQSQMDAVRPVLANSGIANQLMDDALKVKIHQLDEQRELQNNSERMVGINNYYTQRYEAHSSVMKKIVLFCGIIILIIFLMKIGFISDSISSILIIATLSVGIIIVGMQVWDISRRNNIDFDKYNYSFNPDNVPPRTSNRIDKKTDETYGKQWIGNLCSDITKSASKVKSELAAEGGDYSVADAGSGVGNGASTGPINAIPQPSSSVTTANSDNTSPISSSVNSIEQFSLKGRTKLTSSGNNAGAVPSPSTSYTLHGASF